MGRPRLGPKTQRFQMVITSDEMEAIEAWRHRCRIPSTSEAIRRLCKTAIVLADHNEADRQKWLASLDEEKTAGTPISASCTKCGGPLGVTSYFLGFGPDRGTFHLQCLPAGVSPLPILPREPAR